MRRGAATWRGAATDRHAVYTRPVTNPFYTAGWVRSCLQDESGRLTGPVIGRRAPAMRQAAARTVQCRAGYRVKAGRRASLLLPCLREDRSECDGRVFRRTRFLLSLRPLMRFSLDSLPVRFPVRSVRFREPPTRYFIFFSSLKPPNCQRARLFFSRVSSLYFHVSFCSALLSSVAFSRHQSCQ